MIRLLQQDNRIMKIIFAVIIGLAAITMVITLVPGIFDNSGGANDATVYATVRQPGFFGRTIGESTQVKSISLISLLPPAISRLIFNFLLSRISMELTSEAKG